MRNQYVPCHKYDTPFTAYLDENIVGGGFHDEETGDIESSFGSIVRIGRYILTYSTTGFVDRETFWNVEGAVLAFRQIQEDYDNATDEA